MESTFGILRRNAAMFPGVARLAALEMLATAAFVWLVALAAGATAAKAALIGVVVVVASAACDLLAFALIRRNPVMYARARRLADAMYRAVAEPEGIDPEESENGGYVDDEEYDEEEEPEPEESEESENGAC